MPSTECDELVEFDLSAITPGTIRNILKRRPSNSSPGEDEITYHHLKKLPSAHYFLATLFSKILLEDHAAPESWCQAKIKLIPKSQDLSNPENFRPIALTSTIGKPFNKILALRLEYFLRSNDIVDSSLQKGFLTNINGTMEHIFATSAIIQNAVQNGLPLSVTFLDLKNAFVSVPHQLIYDMLSHIQLPLEVRSYISSVYSQLTARIVTKNGSTPSFPISRGVFQGDTMSPLIFLITFNPIIQLAQSLSTCGFRLKRSDPTSRELPKVNSHLYVQWDEEDSDEPQGWYLAKVTSVSADGTATVLYRKGRMLESINLSKTNWFPAPGNGKWYLPSPPLTVTITNTKQSKTHKVKGYADDLSMFSSSTKDHAAALQTIDKHCSDLDLRLKPSKCVSFIYDGKKVLRNVTFPLKEGSTKNICTGPNKFLGHTLCHTLPVTAKESGKRFMNSFLEKLDSLDTSPTEESTSYGFFVDSLFPHFILFCQLM